jgi:hypothetical protein
VRFLIDECLTVDLVSVAGQFAPDSPLEGDGFEPSVPVAREPVYIAEMNWGDRRGQPKNSAGYRWFESISLQQTVCLSPANVFEGREPRLSARVSAAGLATGSAETRRVFQFAPVGGNISVGPYSSTALPLNGADEGAR